jgi:hypothetical protein
MIFPEKRRFSGPAQKPLELPELERMWRWERRMIWFNATAMLLMIAGIVAFRYLSENVLYRRGVLVMIATLVVVGAFVQFREVCPRCKSRLGRQSRFVLPDSCRHCGVDFPRPPVPRDEAAT